MIELTLARTKELLAEAVAEKGEDFVYTNRDGHEVDSDGVTPCHYVHDDKPGCIVGNVLHKAGVPLDELSRFEGQDAQEVTRSVCTVEEGDVIRLLSGVQDRQDRGTAWGEAVSLALDKLENDD